MKKIIGYVSLVWLLLIPVNALAQTETPPATELPPVTGEVSGSLVNMSGNEEAPGPVEIMLHAWDQNFAEKLMLHGETAEDGSFLFDEVTLEPGVFYAVMATYQGATYLSEPVIPAEGQTSLEIQVPIYETTDQLDAVSIDQLHVLFYFSQGGLAVTEVYILSNQGDHTVSQAVALEDETRATLKFSLPPDAANVTFNTRSSGRFVQFPGGFADNEPLIPGEGSGQVMVSFILPYVDEQTYQYEAVLPTKQINFLIDTSSDVTLEGENLVSKGTETMQNGSTFSVFRHEEIQTGDKVTIKLSGKPQAFVDSPKENMGEVGATPSNSIQNLAIGGVILGLALMGVGFWWFRKPEEEEEPLSEVDDQALDEAIRAIAALDRAHEEHEIDDEAYEQERVELRQRVKDLLVDRD